MIVQPEEQHGERIALRLVEDGEHVGSFAIISAAASLTTLTM